MALTADNHIIDPVTSFAVNPDTGHPIGLVPAPIPVVSDERDYPTWVTPHESQIVRKQVDGAPDHVSTPGFEYCHVNRVDGSVTVLVHDEDEEKIATSAYEPIEPEVKPADQFLREVRSDVEQAKRDDAEALNRKISNDQAVLEADEAQRRQEANAHLSQAERDAAVQLAADERARAVNIAKS